MPAAYVISTTGRLLQGTSTRTRRLWLGGLFTLALVPLLGVMLRAPSATDLGRGHAIEAAGVLAEWAQGNVMVVIRHAERCDRSQNQCLGDATGITIEGTRVAAVAGQALEAMGLEDTDFVTSPLLRTVQTSQAITGRKVTPVEWLQACEAPSVQDLLAMKQPGHNLVVVTHSGCIEHYEHQLGVGGTPSAGYVSALFLSGIHNSSAKVLGYLDAPAWQTLSNKALK